MGRRELTFEELATISSENIVVNNECPEEFNTDNDFIGQEKALEALDFAININEPNYNIYLAGDSILNKAKFIQKFVKDKTEKFTTPVDWCYVYNFDDPSMPKPIKLEAGKGKQFKEDMNNFIASFEEDLYKQFESIEFQIQKNKIENRFKEKNETLMKQIKIDAVEFDFDTQITDKDIFFIPIVNNEKLSEDMFDNLTEEEQDSIIKKSEILQERATEVLKLIKENQNLAEAKVKQLKTDIAIILLRDHILELLNKYKNIEDVINYLKDVERDIVKDLDSWIDTKENDDTLISLLPNLYKNNNTNHKKKYDVNLLVDNSELKGAPVVYGVNPSFYNLIGKIEQENELGTSKSDFTKIKPGLLHRANGGFLILELDELINQSYAWYILKLVLKTGKIYYKELKESNTSPTDCIKPIPIPINVKVILIGHSIYYQILKQYDTLFGDLFKVKIFFQYDAERTEKNTEKLISYITSFAKNKNISNVEHDALLALVKYSTRLVMEKDKLMSCLDPIKELLIECCVWADRLGSRTISKELVEKAIKERENRLNYVEIRIDELINSNQILIDVKDKKVGQINALAVIDLGDYAFAKPTRITATTFKGKAGVINIEKESNMSGNVHDKGVHVLTGYLGNKYAKKHPLSLTCQICFEQNYSFVDGDSASSAELYAIISSISDIPIAQNIAVTGSINQFGEIQPIGGATYKVEGFYNVCKKKGFTGNQGVIIPYQNIKDLVLKDEILESIKKGEFHIYPVKNVDEGLEILLGMSAETIHKIVNRKLSEGQKKR